MKARLALVATMFVVAILNACGDVAGLEASRATTVDTLSVFALSGTPPIYPSGIALLARQPVTVDGFASFDIAFDIDDAGNAIVYPVKLVVASPGGARQVGLQRISDSFENVAEAPKTGFQTDSGYVARAGETVVVQSAHNFSNDLCQFAINPFIYAKVAVDSVKLDTRTIYLRLGLDSNCGFRSFATGIPTS
ncbi:MAG: hypothetical protein ACJ77R_14765 [Gemmatimonadaceae bacterium]